jgi:hypothetical protein
MTLPADPRENNATARITGMVADGSALVSLSGHLSVPQAPGVDFDWNEALRPRVVNAPGVGSLRITVQNGTTVYDQGENEILEWNGAEWVVRSSTAPPAYSKAAGAGGALLAGGLLIAFLYLAKGFK